MRETERIDPLLEKLGEYWKTMSDMRLGQLLTCLAGVSKDLFYLEDSELLRKIKDGLIRIEIEENNA